MKTVKYKMLLSFAKTLDLDARAEVQKETQWILGGGKVIQALGRVAIVEVSYCLGFHQYLTFHDNVGEILSHADAVIDHVDFKLLSELKTVLAQLVHQGVL